MEEIRLTPMDLADAARDALSGTPRLAARHRSSHFSNMCVSFPLPVENAVGIIRQRSSG